MRKVEFAWLLPVCMVLLVVAIGAVLFKAVYWLQEPVVAEVVTTKPLANSAAAVRPTVVRRNTTLAAAEAIAAGDALFKGNCAQCHAVNDVVVGPALGGLTRRRPLSWIIPWVKNSSKVVASGDAYAVALFDKYQKQQMPSFQLSAAEIKAIVAYVDSEENAGPSVAAEDVAAL